MEGGVAGSNARTSPHATRTRWSAHSAISPTLCRTFPLAGPPVSRHTVADHTRAHRGHRSRERPVLEVGGETGRLRGKGFQVRRAENGCLSSCRFSDEPLRATRGRIPRLRDGLGLMQQHPGGPKPVAQHCKAIGKRCLLHLHEDLSAFRKLSVDALRVLLTVQ